MVPWRVRGGVGENCVAFPVPLQVAVAVVPVSVHETKLFAFVKMGRLIVPVGVVDPLVEVSVTVAVHVTSWFVVTVVGVHTRLMLVGCRLATVICTEMELAGYVESPLYCAVTVAAPSVVAEKVVVQRPEVVYNRVSVQVDGVNVPVTTVTVNVTVPVGAGVVNALTATTHV